MAKNYYGTNITGTSTTATVFKKSGVKKAAKNDVYTNTAFGYVYVCTKAGAPKDAKWKYVRTDVICAPTVPVRFLSLSRGGNGSRSMTGSWSLQDAMTDDKRCDRVLGLICQWTLGTSSGNVVRRYSFGLGSTQSDTSKSENLDSFSANSGNRTGSYNRSSFYPYSGKPKLYSATVTVDPYNMVGEGAWSGVAQSATYKFGAPRAPSISSPSFNTSNGTVSATVTTDAGNDAYERLWTQYQVIVTDLSKSGSQRTRTTSSGTSTSTSFALSYDASNYQSLTSNQYIQVKFRARAQGYAGDSAWVESTYYVSFPKPVSIPTSDSSHVTASSRDASGKVIVPIVVSRPTGFPVDSVKLQRLVNVTYSSPSAIPGDASWEDSGAVDDGNCTALVGSVSEMLPDKGKHTWVRVKAWHASETALFSYSNVVEVPLYEPASSATDNECSITSARAGADGESVEVVVAWDSKTYTGDEDTTGIELSWSTDEIAWQSTKPPSTFEFTWSDASVDSSASSSWNRSAHITIRDLHEGETHYVRARCFTDDENGERSYGNYCNAVTCQTASTPPSVVLSAPVGVATGDGIPFTWVLSSSARQTAWQLFRRRYVQTSDLSITGGKAYYTVSGGVYSAVAEPSAGSLSSYYEALEDVLADGSGEAGAHVLPASRVEAFASDGSLRCRVRCTTGGEYVESNEVSVNIAEYPEISVTASDLTAQPFQFSVTSSVPSFTLAYVVAASGSGVTGDPAILVDPQPAGDVVATGTVAPQTTASTGNGVTTYSATVTLASGLPFRDGGSYRLSATATDMASGLMSDEASAGFSVAWSHQAPVPPDFFYQLTDDESLDEDKAYYALDDGEYSEVEEPAVADIATYYERVAGITVTPVEDEDGSGAVRRACEIALAAPADADPGDLYDLYRVTHDGAELIGSGLDLSSTWTDLYAPYGDAGDYCYRVACRTADGDVEWRDFPYYMDAGCLRFDFGGSYVELPYNLAISDGYEKDAEVRTHMDGSSEAYFNAGVARKATLSTDVVRIEDARTASGVRDLAQHRGTAFTRTPDGSAYEAHVQVRNMDVGYGVIAAKFEAVRVATADDHKLPASDETVEEEADGLD